MLGLALVLGAIFLALPQTARASRATAPSQADTRPAASDVGPYEILITQSHSNNEFSAGPIVWNYYGADYSTVPPTIPDEVSKTLEVSASQSSLARPCVFAYRNTDSTVGREGRGEFS